MSQKMLNADMNIESPQLLQMEGIVKAFGGNRVLHGVDFDLRRGEVHILAGENGAGKSTLIKILGGVHRPDKGSILINGQEERFHTPRDATAKGVAIIHQELSLVPSLSVADNIFLGREKATRSWMNYRAQHEECRTILHNLGLNIDTRKTAGDLPISLQQMVEITKALARNADIVVMDEPTSALNDPEVQHLFNCINELKEQGCGIIYITHKLEEVYRIADRITVLRDGNLIASDTAEAMPAQSLIRHMVGREIKQEDTASNQPSLQDAPIMLQLEDFTVQPAEGNRHPRVDRVSLSVHEGEILGIAGLHGSGNSELLLGLFGAYGRKTTGNVLLKRKPYHPTTPRHAIQQGIALITNDRQRTGLVLGMSVLENATLACLPTLSPFGVMNNRRQHQLATQSTASLHLRAASIRQDVATLSGGNQQKVVLAKWLNTDPRVILLDEPTRGVDIGAKQEIYQLMQDLSQLGHVLLLITSEMPELLMMSDRILVMHRGQQAALFSREEATQQRILHAAMGGSDENE